VEAVKPKRHAPASVCHVACDASLAWDGKDRDFVRLIARLTNAEFVAEAHSTWSGLPKSGSIHAFLTVGFNYRGADGDRLPDLGKVEGDWRQIGLDIGDGAASVSPPNK
jgi:hypothetical protein